MTQVQRMFIFSLFLNCQKMISCYDNIIDVDDILTENYMPTALMVLENPEEGVKSLNETFKTLVQNTDGSLNNAMETMNFHRNMMNQYLCRSYIAEEIISEMSSPRVKRRMSHVTPGSVVHNSDKIELDVKNELIQDEGSSNYKNWLSKSTTLEDIYRHYNQPADKRDGEVAEEEFYEEENVGGYQNHHQEAGGASHIPAKGGQRVHGSNLGYYYPSSGHSGDGHSGFDISGHEDLHEDHGSFDGHEQEHIVHAHYPPRYQGPSKYEKDYDLSELFEIALTALAYLSFGMFLIHVIMCISMTSNAATTPSVLMPMSMSPTATATGGGTAMSATAGGTTGNGQAGGTGVATGAGGGSTGTGSGTTSTGSGTTGTGSGATSMGATGGDSGGTGPDSNQAGGSTTAGDGGTSTGGDGTSTAGGTGGDAYDGAGMGGTGTGNGGDSIRDTFNFRLRRDIPTITNPDNKVLNELARRVLTSIEAALIANSDQGNCLKRTLCENNKYSRDLEGNHRIMVPIWSLGMSWLAGRLVKTTSPSVSMLDSLKASILGLGKANCETIYQSCDLRTERENRRRKKRK